MSEQEKIQLFEDQKIRTAWDTEKEEWYFSVTDVISVLTGQQTARGASNYWAKLKQRLKEEGADELLTNCQQLKMTASDGKRRATDVATTEQLLRIIQSVPSPRAEPVKRWLAEVGRERIEETIDPEQAIDRALETYLKKGYDPDWVHQRLLSIRIRNELTDEWQKRGVEKGREFAILTDEISRAWSGMTTRQYKNLKGLKKENLRDNMSDTELVLTMLAEASTRDISTPKTVIMDNNIGNAWEDDCYNLAHAVAFDTAEGAVQTVSVTNTTGATVTYEGSSCICIGIQNKGLATVAATEDGQPDVKVEIISMTIE